MSSVPNPADTPTRTPLIAQIGGAALVFLWILAYVLLNVAGFSVAFNVLYVLVFVAIVTFIAAIFSVRRPERRPLSIIALVLSIVANPAVLLIGYVIWANVTQA